MDLITKRAFLVIIINVRTLISSSVWSFCRLHHLTEHFELAFSYSWSHPVSAIVHMNIGWMHALSNRFYLLYLVLTWNSIKYHGPVHRLLRREQLLGVPAGGSIEHRKSAEEPLKKPRHQQTSSLSSLWLSPPARPPNQPQMWSSMCPYAGEELASQYGDYLSD